MSYLVMETGTTVKYTLLFGVPTLPTNLIFGCLLGGNVIDSVTKGSCCNQWN